MEKVDYNIEFAHIYTNENFSEEHYQATKTARAKVEELKKSGKSFATSVLVDNYNSTDHILDVNKFVSELGAIGVSPDFIVYEADLVKYKEKCLGVMTGKLKRQYSHYIFNNGKCPCSFLVAIWHLIRLGVWDFEDIKINTSEKHFIGEKIITILPKRYGAIESKAIDIIKSTPFADRLSDMEHIFF